MKTEIEPFVSLTGWAPGVGAGFTPDSLCEHRAFVADDLPASVVFRVAAGSEGHSVRKSVTLTLPDGYDHLVVHVWSRNLAPEAYRQPADFPYSLTLDGATYWLLPAGRGRFATVVIQVANPVVDRVEITARHAREDYLIVSGLYAVKEDQPLDVLTGIAAGIAAQVAELVGTTLVVGTVTAAAGATVLPVGPGAPWVDRYAVVRVESGGHVERHQLDRAGDDGWTLMSTYDGPALLHAHAGAAVTLEVPVTLGSHDQEVEIPGVTVWAMDPDPLLRSSDVEQVTDSWTASGARVGRVEQAVRYQVLIDCEARQNELLALVSRAVRRWLGRGRLWVNGTPHDFAWTDPARYLAPEGVVDAIRRVQYELGVEVAETRQARAAVPLAGPAGLTVEVRNHG